MFQGPLSASLLKKAQDKKLLTVNLVDLRDFTTDKHKTADDSPYGGGAGMVMKADVIAKAIARGQGPGARIIYMCPTGKLLTQERAKQLAKEERLVILCGHYEGVDERVKGLIDEEISIGDYVLTGGELPAMVLVDAVARHVPGVVKEADSVANDSFFAGLLDYPSYTKPEEFDGQKVPDVLLSGHHAEIERWRRKETLRSTLYRRPDLLAKAELSDADHQLLEEVILLG